MNYETYKKSIGEYLLRYREIDNQTNCWLWIGGRTKEGYGRAHCFEGIISSPHRLSAYVWLNFDIESKLQVCHSCDNPSCFNPDHLFIGTHKDNMLDAVKKGRMKKGEKHYKSKLTNKEIEEFVNQYNNGNSIKDIAKNLKVTPFNLYAIKKGKTWKHLNLQFHPRNKQYKSRILNSKEISEIIYLRNKGNKLKQLATTYNCSIPTIWNILNNFT